MSKFIAILLVCAGLIVSLNVAASSKPKEQRCTTGNYVLCHKPKGYGSCPTGSFEINFVCYFWVTADYMCSNNRANVFLHKSSEGTSTTCFTMKHDNNRPPQNCVLK